MADHVKQQDTAPHFVAKICKLAFQRVLNTYIVSCRVSITGITSMVWVSTVSPTRLLRTLWVLNLEP